MVFVKSSTSLLQTLTSLSFSNGLVDVLEVTTLAKISTLLSSPPTLRFVNTPTLNFSQVQVSEMPRVPTLTCRESGLSNTVSRGCLSMVSSSDLGRW